MPAPALPSTISLQTLRDEILWSKLACLADKYAKPQAPKFDSQLTQWPKVSNEQLAHWDAQTTAQFTIWRINDRMDTHIDVFNVALLAVVGQKRKDPHYTLYMSDPPSTIKKSVLGSALETVRGWAAMLLEEDEPTLSAFAAKFAKDVADGDAALDQATLAAAANTQFRSVGGLAQYIALVAQTRDEVYVDLIRSAPRTPIWPRTMRAHSLSPMASRRPPNKCKRSSLCEPLHAKIRKSDAPT